MLSLNSFKAIRKALNYYNRLKLSFKSSESYRY